MLGSHIPLNYQLISLWEIHPHGACSDSARLYTINNAKGPLGSQFSDPLGPSLVENSLNRSSSLLNMFLFGRCRVHHYLVAWVVLCDLTVTSLYRISG